MFDKFASKSLTFDNRKTTQIIKNIGIIFQKQDNWIIAMMKIDMCMINIRNYLIDHLQYKILYFFDVFFQIFLFISIFIIFLSQVQLYYLIYRQYTALNWNVTICGSIYRIKYILLDLEYAN